MGTGFTIDTPIRLAPLGIHSAISLVNDSLIEFARRDWCQRTGRAWTPVDDNQDGFRRERIRLYLDLVQQLVDERTDELRRRSFYDPNGPSRYFSLLPTDSALRRRYTAFMEAGASDQHEESALRQLIVPGRVDVNIMTKLDRGFDHRGRQLKKDDSEALSAAQGFLSSNARGALILSAGANPKLFAQLGEWDCLFPDEDGNSSKQIILKVSDYRSANIQGRMLARRGLWIAEYRIESGLNCGGHAFPTEGKLLGPIMDEFRQRRSELEEGLLPAWQKGLQARGIQPPSHPPKVRIAAQGGIGTHKEDSLVREFYNMDGTGWGTPFLLVPEAVRLDEETEKLLLSAKQGDVMLSHSSPLGVRFWTVLGSPSEQARLQRIRNGLPGSVCHKGHLALDTSYSSVPLCKGSRAYQKRRLAELDPEDPDYDLLKDRITAPACICDDLGGAYQKSSPAISPSHAPPAAICPGPNLVNFQQLMTLEAIVDHIYGRGSALTQHQRSHFLLREAELYLDVLAEEISLLGTALQVRSKQQLEDFAENLGAGLSTYERQFTDAPETPWFDTQEAEAFHSFLLSLRGRLESMAGRLRSYESGLKAQFNETESALPR